MVGFCEQRDPSFRLKRAIEFTLTLLEVPQLSIYSAQFEDHRHRLVPDGITKDRKRLTGMVR